MQTSNFVLSTSIIFRIGNGPEKGINHLDAVDVAHVQNDENYDYSSSKQVVLHPHSALFYNDFWNRLRIREGNGDRFVTLSISTIHFELEKSGYKLSSAV